MEVLLFGPVIACMDFLLLAAKSLGVGSSELHQYQPQTISATEKNKLTTSKSISATCRYWPQKVTKSAVIVMCIT